MEYKDATDVIAWAHNALDKLDVWVRRSWVSRVFWHSVNVQWYTPPVITGTSWELDEPNRKSRTLILRYSWGKSVVLGFWSKTGYDEAEALLHATIHGRERTEDERIAYDEANAWNATRGEDGSDPVLQGGSGLRVRATTDARADG